MASAPQFTEQHKRIESGGGPLSRYKTRSALLPFKHFDERFPVIFYDVSSPEIRSRMGAMGIWNRGQTDVVVSLLDELEGNLQNGASVLIACLYHQQTLDVLGAIARRGYTSARHRIRVETIDGSNGNAGGEYPADIVVLLTTRSNVSCDLGLAANVDVIDSLVSLANGALILIGDVRTLSSNHEWKKTAQCCEDRRAIIGGPTCHWTAARHVSKQRDIDDPYRTCRRLRGLFYQWTVDKLVKELQHRGVKLRVIDSVHLPETRATTDGRYSNGASGDFLIRFESEADAKAFDACHLLRFQNRDNNRYIEVFKIQGDHRMRAHYQSKVIIIRGFAPRPSDEELKYTITRHFPDVTFCYMKRMNYNEVALLTRTAEDARYASARYHLSNDIYGCSTRYLEIWQVLDVDFCTRLEREYAEYMSFHNRR